MMLCFDVIIFFIDRVLNVHYRSFNLGFKVWDSKFLFVSTHHPVTPTQVFPCLFVWNATLLNS